MNQVLVLPTHVCYACGSWWTVRESVSNLLVHLWGEDMLLTWVEATDRPVCPYDAHELSEWVMDGEHSA